MGPSTPARQRASSTFRRPRTVDNTLRICSLSRSDRTAFIEASKSSWVCPSFDGVEVEEVRAGDHRQVTEHGGDVFVGAPGVLGNENDVARLQDRRRFEIAAEEFLDVHLQD